MKWIDMHCDTLSEIAKMKKSVRACPDSLYDNHLCVDIRRLRQQNCSEQFFACYINAAEYGEHVSRVRRTDRKRWEKSYAAVLEMIRMAHDETYPGFSFIRTRQEMESGELSGILTVEEGGILNGKLSRLDELYRKGIRLITLTWNYENCIGYPNSRSSEIMRKGLTDFGIQTVERMNELGMIIDVSHLSDGGFWDCIRYSRYPVAASHSNSRSLCCHPRNLSDGMLRALGEKGGVAGLNFYSVFLARQGRASMEELAAHAVRMMQKGGEDVVSLGTDFDGFEREFLPEGITGVEDIEVLWDALKKKNITPRQIDKIAYGNAKRLMNAVWKEKYDKLP